MIYDFLIADSCIQNDNFNILEDKYTSESCPEVVGSKCMKS